MSFPPGPEDPRSPEPEVVFVDTVPPRRREATIRQVLLLLLTILTTTLVGSNHYLFYQRGFNAPLLSAEELALLQGPSYYLHGLWYSISVLAILGCHEMGHYVACLRHGVDASRPYFIPAPPPFLSGTLGAFIRVRSRFPSRVALFDIGIAGPIAGFLVTVPLLFIGMAMSRPEPPPADPERIIFVGKPLLHQLAALAMFGELPPGHRVVMHPMAFAAWFGQIATAMNLFPFGQLDGGHITYAMFGRRSTILTLALVPVALALTLYSLSWLLWTVLLLVMLVLVGPRHPATMDDTMPLSRGRIWLAVFALIIMIVCFTPAPLEPFVPGGGR